MRYSMHLGEYIFVNYGLFVKWDYTEICYVGSLWKNRMIPALRNLYPLTLPST